jgi:toxin YoeB
MKFRLAFKEQALKELEEMRKSGNKVLLRKIQTLLTEILDTPFEGTGKPRSIEVPVIRPVVATDQSRTQAGL